MSAGNLQAVRGMSDILEDRTPVWQRIEAALRELAQAYGYREIRLPVVERTELFQRSIGEVTDIVEKEMYTFEDRNGDSLTLRPEGTAGCVRACIQHGLLHNQTRRLWYLGPMFRHERPQKGRYRQFHQLGVEAFGMPGPDIDAEQILMTARLWRMLGLRDVTLQINSLGTPAARAAYREELVAYLERCVNELDSDSQRRLHSNPLRILDSKNPDMEAVIAGAPRLDESLDEASRAHFDGLRALLDEAGVAYEINPRLVRGLDYYGRTVFEWITDRLGAQGTVCAGGRFDELVSGLGGRPTPAVGFAIGLERLAAMLEEAGVPGADCEPHAYMVLIGPAALHRGMAFAEELRDALPGLRLQVHCGGGGARSQFKRADRSGAAFALILGEEEVARGEVGVKPLRGAGEQQVFAQQALAGHLRECLGLNTGE